MEGWSERWEEKTENRVWVGLLLEARESAAEALRPVQWGQRSGVLGAGLL